MAFKKGDRIRLSDDAHRNNICPQHPHRLGVFVSGPSRHNCVSVLWDGNKTTDTLHIDYIDLAPPENPS